MCYKVYPVLCLSFRLSFPNNKFACEVFLSYLSSFFLYPAFKTNLLYTAEIVKFHIMRVLSGLIDSWGEKGAREITTVTTKLYVFGFDTIQSCTSLWRQMIMLPVLKATPFASNFFLWYTHFGVNQFRKPICKIVLVKFAVEAVQSTGCNQCFFVFYRSSYKKSIHKAYRTGL